MMPCPLREVMVPKDRPLPRTAEALARIIRRVWQQLHPEMQVDLREPHWPRLYLWAARIAHLPRGVTASFDPRSWTLHVSAAWLRNTPRSIRQALLAHELAHELAHAWMYVRVGTQLEDDARAVAKGWGFEDIYEWDSIDA